MNDRLIRAAIALYPPDWRTRYGGELQQVMVEACEDSASSAERVWMLIGIAAGGVRERVVHRGPRLARTLATVAVGTIAAIMLIGGGSAAPPVPPTPVTLAAGAHVDPRFSETHYLTPDPAHGPTIILGPHSTSKNILAVVGGHVTVHLDPRHDQVTSIQPR